MDLSLLEIPENKINQLKKKGFESIEDLAAFYPKRYYDFRRAIPIDCLMGYEGEIVCIVGRIIGIYHGNNTLTAMVSDGSERLVAVMWFRQGYIEQKLFPDRDYVFCGKIQYTEKYKNFTMASPICFGTSKEQYMRIVPEYRKVKGMSSEYLNSCVVKAVSLILADKHKHEYLTKDMLEKFQIPDYKQFLTMVHGPADEKALEIVERRKVVDKLFPFALKMEQKKKMHVSESPYTLTNRKGMEKFISSLPFPLTEGQDKAVHSMAAKMSVGQRVDALVQGDVGCGKTVIATSLAVAMATNGYQTALMCPTTVLAEQHYTKIKKQLEPMGIHVELLISGMKAKEKRESFRRIKDGTAQIIIGTHAVIAKDVEFNSLALTIVDEEHRFGVEQRDLLREKAQNGVHNISMTATPIPRTIAVTIYGENTEIINIETLPQGRKPVKTILFGNSDKTNQSMYNQIKEGHQCYVVCPLIEDSESESMASVQSAESVFAELQDWFKQYPEVTIDMITGNMKPDEIKEKIGNFADNKTNIIVSTTIIEVGIDVPNATVIVIKNPERFGLAQLHQLRGRVGRGSSQSYCVLQSYAKDNERLNAMVATTNGFEIAQKDMELRGTGDIVGTKQSGIDECLTLMLQNRGLYQTMCMVADKVIETNNKRLLKLADIDSAE